MQNKYHYLLSFLAPLIVRAIPEIVSFPWPLGYDTVTWYAPVINLCQIYGPLYSLTVFTDWRNAPLLYMFMGFLGYVSRLDPFLVTKCFGPFLSGCLGLVVFFFSRNYLGWSDKKSLACALICASYFVTLRLTWDSYRNVLGLILFIIALSQLPNLEKRRNALLFFVFCFLCAFSHELVTIILLITLFYLASLEIYRKLKGGVFQKGRLIVLVSSFLLPMVLFALYYTNWLGNSLFYFYNPFSESLFGGVLVDYISLRTGFYLYPSVDVLNAHILLLFFICFGPILPFVVLGYFKNEVLDVTTLFLLVGSFMPMVLPHSALPLWSRWMLMLTVPFSIYVANFLFPDETGAVLAEKLRVPVFMRAKLLVLIILLLVIFSSTYMVLPAESAFPYFSNFNTARYLPPTMQYNTVPISRSQDIVIALTWLSFNMSWDSCVVAHESLAGWTKLAFPFKQIYTYSSVDVYLESALFWSQFFGKVYILTMAPYDIIIAQRGFNLVFQFGLVRIYTK